VAHAGEVRRWDVFWIDLEPHVGREQGGDRRLGIVVSNDGFNQHFGVVTIVPLTKLEGKQRQVYPFEVLLPKNVVGNELESIVMPQQVRTISKLRLLDRIGALESHESRAEIENRLLEHLGIEFEAEEFS
jgi:mRNA interferase MazF